MCLMQICCATPGWKTFDQIIFNLGRLKQSELEILLFNYRFAWYSGQPIWPNFWGCRYFGLDRLCYIKIAGRFQTSLRIWFNFSGLRPFTRGVTVHYVTVKVHMPVPAFFKLNVLSTAGVYPMKWDHNSCTYVARPDWNQHKCRMCIKSYFAQVV